MRQFTLALLKPDITHSTPYLQYITSQLKQKNLKIVQERVFTFSMQEAQKFYSVHTGRFFFNRLCGFMARFFLFFLLIYLCLICNQFYFLL